MPLSGPLQLIWGIDTSDPDDNLNIQSQLDRFRAELELSIAEYEKAVNVEFIEIHYDGTQSAPWTYDFSVQGGLTEHLAGLPFSPMICGKSRFLCRCPGQPPSPVRESGWESIPMKSAM